MIDWLGWVAKDVSLSKSNSWRVGGAAKWYFAPESTFKLTEFLSLLPPDISVYWLGLGSNVLIPDEGVDGVVINTMAGLNGIRQVDERTVECDAGVPSAKFARFCARLGLAGAAFFAGIPGTMGGALTMNAGAFGGQTWDRLCSVLTLSRGGELKRHLPDAFTVAYRCVEFSEPVGFISGRFQFTEGAADTELQRIRSLLKQRALTQPTGQFSCGSVFKNPKGDHAARLIESCDLKGEQIGAAQVSTKHANFIINQGGASASDIRELIALCQEVVENSHGVRLEPEVKMW